MKVVGPIAPIAPITPIDPIAPIVLEALVGGDVWRESLKGRPPPLDARMQAVCVLVGKPLTWEASERLRGGGRGGESRCVC